MTTQEEKNIILSIGPLKPLSLAAIKKYEKENGVTYRIAYLLNTRANGSIKEFDGVDIVLTCDMSSEEKIAQTLQPYLDEFIAVTCTSEPRMQQFKNTIPHVPYLKTPTETSLDWATNKIAMREMLATYNKKISPKHLVVTNATKKTVKEIETKVGFPVVVKPAGLAASVLVSVCYHEEELSKTLKTILQKVRKAYKDRGRETEPQVLVEQYMEGKTYSIDCYVTSIGRVYHCPFVEVMTGRDIGLDDFFGYQQSTPAVLHKDTIAEGQDIAEQAVHALGLRSTTVHVELIKTTDGWKVIELGPRIGGFREKLYELSYGFNHTMNDILVRIPQQPVVKSKVIGHSAALKFFAPKEGRLEKIIGIKKAQDVTSVKSFKVLKKNGDMCRYSKNGGSAVIGVVLFQKDRSKLLADVRRLEKMIKIETN